MINMRLKPKLTMREPYADCLDFYSCFAKIIISVWRNFYPIRQTKTKLEKPTQLILLNKDAYY